MASGWIKLYRQFQSHWIWKLDEPFDRRSAWIDLLYMANFVDNKTIIDGKLVNVERGQTITSTRKLAERWKWSRTKVTSFLDMLESDNMIKLEKDTKKTVITIVNYGNFQCGQTSKKPSRANEEPTKDTNKEYKNIKSFKKEGYSARARKPSTWNNLESEERKKQRDDFLDEFQKHIVGG